MQVELTAVAVASTFQTTFSPTEASVVPFGVGFFDIVNSFGHAASFVDNIVVVVVVIANTYHFSCTAADIAATDGTNSDFHILLAFNPIHPCHLYHHIC